MSNQRENIENVLEKYIPKAAVPICTDWIIHYKVFVDITKKRAYKYGDYRAPYKGSTHKITINHDLNPYQFLLTFVHEMAHLMAHVQHGAYIQSHGKEWKMIFSHVMQHVFNLNVFPHDVQKALVTHMQNPKYSSCADENLMRVMRNYDKAEHKRIVVEELPIGCVFELDIGKTFIKGEKLRKNYSCIEKSTGRKYTVHPLAEVKRVIE